MRWGRRVVCVLMASFALGSATAGAQTSPGRASVEVSVADVAIQPDGSVALTVLAPGCDVDPPGLSGFVVVVPGFDGSIALGRFDTPGVGTATISAGDLQNPAYHRTFEVSVVCNGNTLEGSVTFAIADVPRPVVVRPIFTG